MVSFSPQRTKIIPLLSVAVSFIASFLHFGPLNGSFAALVLSVLFSLFLPGYLLARVFGKLGLPHPISRFVWILGLGLSLTVCLGVVTRISPLPVPVYLVTLHVIMLVLALLPAGASSAVEPAWKLTRRAIPLYALVAICCVVVMGVSYESRHRFYGFEDQPIFISLVDWIAAHPDIHPNDVPLRSRQIGVINGDSRFDTDGFSYVEAVWVWSSGIDAAQLIWFDLATLFIWTVPLITFALAYALTERETAAVWSTAALTLAGLMTLDNLVYSPAYTAFGRFAVFQINTLRQFSITMMLPLALMMAVSYLRKPQRRDLVILVLAGVALAAMHPFQAAIFIIAVGVTAGLLWLAKPNRETLKQLLPLLLVFAVILVLPLVQRLNRPTGDSLVRAAALEDVSFTSTGLFLFLHNLPVLGSTFIRNPENVFYSPVITGAVLLGLALGRWWRRSLAAQFILGTTIMALLIAFTPGLTALVNKYGTTIGLLTTSFLLPIPLVYGLALDNSLQWLLRFRAKRQPGNAPLRSMWVLNGLVAAGLVLVMGALLFEPFPIPVSARDQLNAYNASQSARVLHPSQAALGASLRAHLPPDKIAVLVTPSDVANVVIEDSPNTLITSGRASRNQADAGNNRFFSTTTPPAPWLDSADLDFLAQWRVTHIITMADTTRLAQLRLQPERFNLLDTPDGYTLFAVEPGIQADADEDIYARMNQLYGTLTQPRWGAKGFNLGYPGGGDGWQPIVSEWQGMLKQQPQDERAQLGLAFTYTMIGQDSSALPLWQQLNDHHPDEPLYADAVASTRQALDRSLDSTAPLLAALSSSSEAARVLAARRLLTDTFFYRLSADQLKQILAVTEADSITWDRLANLDNPDGIRKRVALLMNVGEWSTARRWLDSISIPERAPEDLTAQAAAALAMGDVTGALTILQPTTDPDAIVASVSLHRDRWQNNTAAQTYYVLLGNIAERDGRKADAEAAYTNAIQAGSDVVGRSFLTALLRADGQVQQADEALKQAAAVWSQAHNTPMPQFVSLLTIADSGSIYASQARVIHGADEQTLTVTATYGNIHPRNVYPFRSWRFRVVNPDSGVQYSRQVDVPADLPEGALAQISTTVPVVVDVPPLTAALVVIQPRYDDAVTAAPVTVPLVLNRPAAALVPADATRAAVQFGDHIALQGYAVMPDSSGQLQVRLYWQTDAPLDENVQEFVHLIAADGTLISQVDQTPVQNTYSTSQWRVNSTIEDDLMLPLGDKMTNGRYRVVTGFYRLGDLTRLPITPAGEQVADDSLLIYSFDYADGTIRPASGS